MAWQVPPEHAAAAARIPDEVRSALSPAELLARCEHAAELTKTAFAVSDRTLTYGYLERADQVLKAMTRAQLAAELDTLNKAAAAAPTTALASSYAAARSALVRDNPQPPDEQLTKAAAAVAPPPAAPSWQAPTAYLGDGMWRVGNTYTRKPPPGWTNGPDGPVMTKVGIPTTTT